MKTQAKHTSGPWKLKGSKEQDYFVVEGADGDAIGSVDNSPEDRQESEANARLIASSPELLSALKDLHEWVKDKIPEDYNDEGEIGQIVIKAIAKAELKH